MSCTSDEPYLPDFGDSEDEREVTRASRAESQAPEYAPRKWQPPQGTGGQSLLPPADAEFSRRLRALGDRIDAGEELPEKELRYLVSKGSLRLLESRRPANVTSGVLAIERMIDASIEGRVRGANREAGSISTFHLPGQGAATRAPSPGS